MRLAFDFEYLDIIINYEVIIKLSQIEPPFLGSKAEVNQFHQIHDWQEGKPEYNKSSKLEFCFTPTLYYPPNKNSKLIYFKILVYPFPKPECNLAPE